MSVWVGGLVMGGAHIIIRYNVQRVYRVLWIFDFASSFSAATSTCSVSSFFPLLFLFRLLKYKGPLIKLKYTPLEVLVVKLNDIFFLSLRKKILYYELYCVCVCVSVCVEMCVYAHKCVFLSFSLLFFSFLFSFLLLFLMLCMFHLCVIWMPKGTIEDSINSNIYRFSNYWSCFWLFSSLQFYLHAYLYTCYPPIHAYHIYIHGK